MTIEVAGKLLLRIPEVVQVTGYSRSFIYEQIRAGALKAIRVGRTIRIGAEDLQEWIGKQRGLSDKGPDDSEV